MALRVECGRGQEAGTDAHAHLVHQVPGRVRKEHVGPCSTRRGQEVRHGAGWHQRSRRRVREQGGLCVGMDDTQGRGRGMGCRVGGAAMWKGEGVAMHGGRDESLRAPVAVVAVPFCVGRGGMLELKTKINKTQCRSVTKTAFYFSHRYFSYPRPSITTTITYLKRVWTFMDTNIT